MDVIKLSDFYDGDTVQSLKKTVEQVKKDGAKTLYIEPGRKSKSSTICGHGRRLRRESAEDNVHADI